MPRKTKVEAEKTRARILASALSLFVKNGYERTTFNDIAARLKLTKGAVYWHFASKEALLVALVDEMLADFVRQTESRIPRDGLTYPVLADLMVETAERIVADRRGTAFFMLMMTQVKWSEASMKSVREEMLARRKDSPYHAFVRAVENDMAAGRVRADVDPCAVAAASMSIWDGLVRSRIENFLEVDLASTLRAAYAAFWSSIATGKDGRAA